jgi:HK97 family phage major capsid protein
MTLREMKQKRAKLLDDASALIKKADDEKRELSAEERSQVDSLMQQAENMQLDIQQREKLEGLRGELTTGNHQEGMTPEIGMSTREIEQYSLTRAIRSVINGQSHDNGTSLEMEASRAVAKSLKRDLVNGSFFMPYDVMSRGMIDLRRAEEARKLMVSDPTTGGYFTNTTLLTGSFIDLFRARLVLQQAGALVWGGLVGEIAVPKQTGAATFYVIGEDEDLTESDVTINQLRLKPRTGGALMSVTRNLINQSTLDVENFMRAELATVTSLGVGQKCFTATGASNESKGLQYIDGIGSVEIGVSGGAPTWPKIVEMETKVATANADVGRLSYIFNAATRGKLKTTAKVSGQSDFIWDARSGNTPVNGYPAHVTNLLPGNITKGGTANLSAGFFGNWSDFVIALWGTLEVLVDPFTKAANGGVRIVGFQDFDNGVRHEGSFSMCADMATT